MAELVTGAAFAAVPEGFDRGLAALSGDRALRFPAVFARVSHPLDSEPLVFWSAENRVDIFHQRA